MLRTDMIIIPHAKIYCPDSDTAKSDFKSTTNNNQQPQTI